MGKFYSVFLAFLQFSCGTQIFKKPELEGCGPYLSCLLAMVALFLLLWDVRLYPPSLRELLSPFDFVAEYLVATFLFEFVMGSFWFPLENSLLASLPVMGQRMEELFGQYNWECETPCQMWTWDSTGIVFSYMLNIMALVAIMHATRIIDLRLLNKGFNEFFCDIRQRARECLENISKKYKIEYSHIKKITSSRKKRASFYPDDDDVRSGEPMAAYPQDDYYCERCLGDDF